MPSVLGAFSSPLHRPTPAVNPPRHRSPRRPLHASDAIKPLPPPSSFPPLIPFKPSLNGYSSPPLLQPPPSALPRPYKSHPDDHRNTPHLTEPLPSPLPRWNPSPPSFPRLLHAAASPGRHAAARAPMRPEPSSPCSPLSIAPPPVSFSAPERLEAILR
jgi:hypothetical protein